MLPPLSFSPSFGLTVSSLFEVATWIIESLMQAFQCCIFPCQRCLTCFPHTLLYCFSFYSVTSVFTISFDTYFLFCSWLIEKYMEFSTLKCLEIFCIVFLLLISSLTLLRSRNIHCMIQVLVEVCFMVQSGVCLGEYCTVL